MKRFRAVPLSMIGFGAAVLLTAALTSLDATGQHTHDESDHGDSREAGLDTHEDHDVTVSGQADHEEEPGEGSSNCPPNPSKPQISTSPFSRRNSCLKSFPLRVKSNSTNTAVPR